MNFDKKKLLTTILQQCELKIQALQKEVHTLITDAGNNTKSSAGDKHETSRALMQLEQEKLQNQLAILQQQKEELLKINSEQTHDSVRFGSIVQSESETFFISIAFGKIMVDSTTIFLISPQSPLGNAMIGKKKKDIIEFNKRNYTIKEIH